MRGKELQIAKRGSLPEDHPRLCGEKLIAPAIRKHIMGSPPPMRGKVENDPNLKGKFGITPAYAGKRFPRHCSRESCWDHPRLCGEKGMEKKLHICFMGSPPPMRGKAKRAEWI